LTETSIARRVEVALRSVLPRSVGVRRSGSGPEVDFVVNGIAIEAKWLGEGGLRQVRDVLSRKRHLPNIVVARRLSPGAREALSQAGVGWIDESGAAEIALVSIVISKSGHPDPTPEKTARWTTAVLAVAEALLCGGKATVSAMQEATRLSSGSCTKALAVLTQLSLLTSTASRGRGSARQVADANQLLDAYATAAAAMPPAPIVRVGVTWREIPADLADVGKQWKKAGIAWALTGTAAASLIAPYLTSVTTADVYVDAKTIASLNAAAESVGLRPMEGGRLTVRPFPTVTTRLLAEDNSGLRVAPWPRVYVDLRAAGVRGEEAAEHLREFRHGR
jgi:hypothetical protein